MCSALSLSIKFLSVLLSHFGCWLSPLNVWWPLVVHSYLSKALKCWWKAMFLGRKRLSPSGLQRRLTRQRSSKFSGDLQCPYYTVGLLVDEFPQRLPHSNFLSGAYRSGSHCWVQAGIWPFSMQIFTYPPLLQYRATSSTLSSADTRVRTSQGHLREGALGSLLGLGWGWFPDCVVWEVRIFTSLHHCSDKEPAESSVWAPSSSLHLHRYPAPWCLSLSKVLQSQPAAFWLAPPGSHPAGVGVQLCLLSQVLLIPPLDRW